MKKPVKRVLIALTSVVAVIAVGLAATTVGNAVATAVEQDRIEPYGQKVMVDGHEMNVSITGDGPEDIVLLPGFGTASPVLDFQPLVDDLAKDHRVIVVEPFGYGLSDGTDRARTTDNIVTETHDALQQLGIDDYVLMGHSIAGIYGIQFANRYPDEVRAFVGIDSSVPGQPGSDTELPVGLFGAAKNLGLVRLIASFRGTGYDDAVYPAQTQEQIALLTNRNTLSLTYLNAMSLLNANFEDALGTSFPEDLPLLLFVVANNPTYPTWLGLHEEQAAAVDDGTVVPIDGEHYLHHAHAQQIVDDFRSWERTRMPSAE
ncbi:2-(acetamidomethylene)succinate hydrolase [Microbacterium oxydans]|uniref:alpha/beta fold hydrolase n=1 Tax=Microbacterium oxydans TaxID=82380 RepID=UPI001DDD9513|nr:alpha/beta hydrolase [Microbacterium oxydans]CAH0149209.1 2-(acetamidomethylene)succinate hydrolase [Microbacterium oxydans]